MDDEKRQSEEEAAATRFFDDSLAIRDHRLRSIMAEMQKWSAQKWVYEDAPNLVVYSINELAYSYAKRANDLIESMRSLMLSDRVVPSIILARALVETIAMGRLFIEKMEDAVISADFPKLEKYFYRFYAGSKLEDAKVKTIHVNDALRELEEIDIQYMAYLVEKSPSLFKLIGPDPVQTFKDRASLSKTYDKLSEIAHPNGLGTQYLYPVSDAPDNSGVMAHYRYMTGVAIWQAHHLLTALERFRDFPDRFVTKFPDMKRFSEGNPLNVTP